MSNQDEKPSVMHIVAGAALVGLCVLLGYLMRGSDNVNDARLDQLASINLHLTEMATNVDVLIHEDQTYWRGYSEGLTACYKNLP